MSTQATKHETTIYELFVEDAKTISGFRFIDDWPTERGARTAIRKLKPGRAWRIVKRTMQLIDESK